MAGFRMLMFFLIALQELDLQVVQGIWPIGFKKGEKMKDQDSFLKTWGSTGKPKAKKGNKPSGGPMGSQSLHDMKSNTLTDNGGWGKDGVKAQKGFKVGKGKGKGKSDKVFKGLGF